MMLKTTWHLLKDLPYGSSTRLLLRLHSSSRNNPLIRVSTAADQQHLQKPAQNWLSLTFLLLKPLVCYVSIRRAFPTAMQRAFLSLLHPETKAELFTVAFMNGSYSTGSLWFIGGLSQILHQNTPISVCNYLVTRTRTHTLALTLTHTHTLWFHAVESKSDTSSENASNCTCF